MIFVNLLIFLLLAIFIFYPIGFLLLNKTDKKLEDQEIIGLAFSLGIIIFVIFSVILGLIQLRVLLLPIFTMIGLYTFYKYRLALVTPWKIFIQDRLLITLLLLGILVQGFINFPSGLNYNGDILFWSSHGHDGIWHVALMEEIKKSIPPQNPAFASVPLYNYHYLVDILMGEFYRIFPFLSALDLYFRFFPVLFSLLIGVNVFAFVSNWQRNKKIGYWAMFFSYFVGSFGYIYLFIKGGSIFGGETVFWAAQQNTILGNPPHAVSHIILPAFFLSFIKFYQSKSYKWLFITFLIGSILAGFKVSGGFVMLIGLAVASLIGIIKRDFKIPLLGVLLALSNFLTFKSMTSKDAAGFLMFLPWWFIRTMIVVKLDWIDLEHKRQHYLSVGTWNAYLRVLQLELTGLLIFIVGNLGMRVIGVIGLVNIFLKRRVKVVFDPVDMLIFFAMITGLIIPLLFVQKGIIYNNIQFMQYFMLIFGFYSAASVYKILIKLKFKILQIIFAALVILFSVPTVIGNLVEFYGPGTTPLSKISHQELNAIDYLKNNSTDSDIFLVAPFDKDLKGKYETQPKPIYAWYSTSYISALSSRRSYLSSEEQVLITGYPLDERRDKVKKFFAQTDYEWNKEFLKNERIKYIYIAKDEIKKEIDVEKNNLEKVFENGEVLIYKIKDV